MPEGEALGASPSPPDAASAVPFGLEPFSPRDYLQRYWPADSMDSEDEFIMRFLHGVYSRYQPANGLLELGGGPVIDKYISASRFVSHIVHTDFSEQALREVELFRQHHAEAWDWRLRCDFAARLEHSQEDGLPLEGPGRDVAQRVRDKLHAGSIRQRDLRQPPDGCSVPGSDLGGISVVSVHSVCECAAHDEGEWRAMLSHVFSHCSPGTLLVMTVNTRTTAWDGGASLVRAVPVTPGMVLDLVRSAGFADIDTQLRSDGAHEATEMQETLALSAVKQ